MRTFQPSKEIGLPLVPISALTELLEELRSAKNVLIFCNNQEPWLYTKLNFLLCWTGQWWCEDDLGKANPLLLSGGPPTPLSPAYIW